MRVRLLGEVAVSNDNGSVTLRSPRLQQIVAILALRPGVVSLDTLADVLWPDAPPANWKAALRNAIARLRHELEAVGAGGDAFVATTAAGYRLAAGYTVDVHEALAAVDEAERALDDGDPDAALELAGPAAGGLGAGLAATLDDDVLLPDRTRVDAGAVRALELAAAAAVQVGRAGMAVRFATDAVERDPLREEAHRRLIDAHLAAGNRSAALRAYESCRRTLVDELGIGPDEHTVALHLRVLGTDTSPRAAVLHSVRFAGRRAELEALDAAAVPGAAVLVVGPAGIGKSRLAHEAAKRLGDRFDGGRFVVELEAVGDDSALAAVAAEIGADLPHGAGSEAVTAALASRGPVLLVLDGADRSADTTTALTLELMVSAPNTAVVVTSRQPLPVPTARRLTVRGLDPVRDAPQCFRAHAERAGVELPSAPAAGAAISRLCRAVGGNPLAIGLLARQAALLSIEDLADLVDRDDGDDGAPGPLEVVIRSSLDLLDADERRVLGRLAAVRGAVELSLVHAVAGGAGLTPQRVTRLLAQLAERGLVELDRGEVRWRYGLHPSVRDASRALFASEAADAYRRLADAIVTMLPTSPNGPPPVDAIRAVFPAVRGLFEATLAGDAEMDRALRIGCWLHRYWAATGTDEGIWWLTRLVAAAGDRSSHYGLAQFGLGYLLVWAGRPEQAAPHLDAACRVLARADDPIAAAAYYYLAGTYENRRPELARANYEFAVAEASRQGNLALATICAEGIGSIECEAGDYESGLERYEAALEARRTMGGDELYKLALPAYAQQLYAAGRLTEADQALRTGERLLGDEPRIANIVASTVRSWLARVDGRGEVARRHALRAADMVESTGVRRLEAMPQPVLALLELDGGDAVAAATRLATAAATASEVDAPWLLADVLDAATLVAVAAGATGLGGQLAGAADTQRARAHVVRPLPGQRELDAALAGQSSPAWADAYRNGAATEPSTAVGLVAELAGALVTPRQAAAG